MKEELFKFTCDYCGVYVYAQSYYYPTGWAIIANSDDNSDGKEFHFSSHKCYEEYDKAHPDTIDCNASFYAASEWFK